MLIICRQFLKCLGVYKIGSFVSSEAIDKHRILISFASFAQPLLPPPYFLLLITAPNESPNVPFIDVEIKTNLSNNILGI